MIAWPPFQPFAEDADLVPRDDPDVDEQPETARAEGRRYCGPDVLVRSQAVTDADEATDELTRQAITA